MEELIKIILAYEKELRDEKDELTEAFGHEDTSAEWSTNRWLVMEELLTKLNLKPL
jgi:hypothetical protein